MEPIQFFNGQFVATEAISFSVKDVGLLRGYGIFDYFKAYHGVPAFLKDHLDRFENSARTVGIEIPFSRTEIESAILQILKHNNFALSGVKLLLTGGDSEDGFTPGKPNFAIINTSTSEAPAQCYSDGISLMTYQFTREMPEAKTLGYATAVRLQPQWQKNGHTDVLYHDGEFISEVSRSNIFLISSDKLITNHDGVLPGISRKKVLQLAGEMGLETEVRPMKLQELLHADEAFITSTNKKVMPLVKLDEHIIGNGKVGEKTKLLMAAFDALLSKETEL